MLFTFMKLPRQTSHPRICPAGLIFGFLLFFFHLFNFCLKGFERRESFARQLGCWQLGYLFRVDVLSILNEFKMEMRARSASCCAHKSDDLSLPHFCAVVHTFGITTEVSIS